MRIVVPESMADLDRDQWNSLVGDDDPFLDYEFFDALERSGVVGANTPWRPCFVTAWRGGDLLGAVPFYMRWDSYGEYIFDFAWAQAYARAGLNYYPKGVVAVPFTPVGGSRFLLAPALRPALQEDVEQVDPDIVSQGRNVAGFLLNTLVGMATEADLSSLHFLFPRKGEHDFLTECGLLSRVTHQYHWQNRDYGSFDDYLADLRSKKRKQVLRERAEVVDQGFEIEVVEGDDVREEHVDAIWQFYLETARQKWSQPYLVRETFELLAQNWKHRIVLVLAKRGGRYLAGTFNARGRHTLFGRYWGAIEHFPALHFECCYWSLIDYAIRRGLKTVEAGAGGEHKFLRGFDARPTYSAHWIAHAGGKAAIERFLEEERVANEATIEGYNRISTVKSERSRF